MVRKESNHTCISKQTKPRKTCPYMTEKIVDWDVKNKNILQLLSSFSSAYYFVAYIANNMNPGQTAPKGSLRIV